MTGSALAAGSPAGATTPTASPVTGRAGDWRLKALAWGLMGTASLLNMLNFNAYPLFRAEVWLVLGVIGLVAVVLGLFEKLAPRLGFVLTGALVWVGTDLNTDSAILPSLMGVTALVAAWFFNENVVKLAVAAFGTVAAVQAGTALMGPAPAHAMPVPVAARPAAKQATLPPLIHVVIDSALGLEGMASDSSFAGLHADSAAFYTKHGFRLYHDAYTRHANTANSIPHILSFGNAPLAKTSQLTTRHLPPKLDYFQTLSDRGYKVSILGANYLDLCTGQAVAECRQVPHSQLSAITHFPMSTRDRSVTLGIALANMASLTTGAYEIGALVAPRFGGPAPVPMRNLQKVASIASILTLQQLQQTLANPQPGHAYFLHLLVPHEPYVFDGSCALKPRGSWTTERSPVARTQRERDYREQTGCMNALIGETLTKLEGTPAGRDAIVIVHGDHGSRIVDERPLVDNPKASIHDIAMTYSTLFAIRAPGIEPGIATGRASLDELLEAAAASDFEAAPPAGVAPAEIILGTWDWVPKKRVALPDFDEN